MRWLNGSDREAAIGASAQLERSWAAHQRATGDRVDRHGERFGPRRGAVGGGATVVVVSAGTGAAVVGGIVVVAFGSGGRLAVATRSPQSLPTMISRSAPPVSSGRACTALPVPRYDAAVIALPASSPVQRIWVSG